MIMLRNKNNIYVIFILKYLLILTLTPELENERFLAFFDSCKEICLNPYQNIYELSNESLSFPYGYVMYLFLLPFFLLSKVIPVSFTILSYIFVELVSIKILNKFFDVDTNKLILPFVLNPIIIYSVGVKGYLDFIPLLFFLLCLNSFKNKRFESALIFLSLGIGTKSILILILPLLLIYIYRNTSEISRTVKSIFLSLVIIGGIYLPIFLSKTYYDSVLKGITEGADVLQNSGIFNLNTLVISQIIIFITYYFFYKNLKKMDYFGLISCLGICTFPLFILNFSNLGWFMWSIPAIVYVFLSLENSRKYLIYMYFLSVIVLDLKVFNSTINENLIAIQFFFSLIVMKYFYQFLVQNKFFRIKSKPILIAIAGDSGVGKSSITSILSDFFGPKNTTIIEIDNYHKYERGDKVWESKTHLDPIVNKLSFYKKQLTEIISGNVEKIREYNHLTGNFDEPKNIKVNDFLLIEGLHPLLMEDLNNIYNLKVYIDLEKNIKDKFKINRDLERNKSMEEIENQIKSREKDYDTFVKPQKKHADLTINTLSLDEETIKIEVMFSTEYLEEILEIFENSKVKLIDQKYDGENAELSFESTKYNQELINELVKSVSNIRDDKFEFGNDEINLKSSLIIYFLSKKLELL